MSDFRRFVESRDEIAFRSLVDAHLGMVFGVAMRRLGDRGLAEEVSQNVFARLGQKAAAIRSEAALPAWLHRATVMECSRAIRGEARRRKRMQKLIEIKALEGDGIDAWEHAQADLDEAVDELPVADREILLQRFYERKSFREIASASGGSEAASQKRASRALAKLAERMRARGFAVPVAVMASGLGLEFGKAAPAGLAAKVSGGASAGGALGSGAAGFVSIMSISKSTFVGAGIALALIAMFTAGGYFSGRASAAREAESRISAAAGDAPAGAGESGVPSALGAGGRGAAPAGGESLRAILTAAAAHFARHRDDADADERGRAELAKLQPGDMEEALREAAALGGGGDAWERTRWNLLRRWAEFAGAEAIAYAAAKSVGDSRYPAISASYLGWASVAPEEAFAHLQAELAGGGFGLGADHRRSLLRSVMRPWAGRDPGAALAALTGLPYDDQRDIARALGGLVEDDSARRPYLDAVGGLEPGRIRTQLIDDAVDRWSRDAPAEAAAWLDSLAFATPGEAFQPATEVAENWFERDAGAAVEWLWEKVPGAMRDEFVEELVREEWMERDPGAARAWLEANGFASAGEGGAR